MTLAAATNPLSYLPIVTSVSAFGFGIVLYRHWRSSSGARHLMWWTIGIFLFGIGSGTEALTTLIGWKEPLFRSWYITGAILGAAPLAQGTAYLMLKRRTADRLTMFLVYFAAIAATFVLLTPIDMSLVDVNRLESNVMEWAWVRAFSPLLNTYALVMLGGGAALSAWRYFKGPDRHAEPPQRGEATTVDRVLRSVGRAAFVTWRSVFFVWFFARAALSAWRSRRNGDVSMNPVWGNTSIAFGTLIVGVGGGFARAGVVEVLYVAEVIGLAFIWWGYRLLITARTESIHVTQTQGKNRRRLTVTP